MFGIEEKESATLPFDEHIRRLKEYNLIKKTLWNCSKDGFIDARRLNYYLDELALGTSPRRETASRSKVHSYREEHRFEDPSCVKLHLFGIISTNRLAARDKKNKLEKKIEE